AARDQLTPQRPDLASYQPTTDTTFQTAHFDGSFDSNTGAITHLSERASGQVWADAEHTLAHFTYEIFSQADYERFWEQYIRNRDNADIRAWAQPDFTKPGLPVESHQEWSPWLEEIRGQQHAEATEFLLKMALLQESQTYGAPAALYLHYRFPTDQPSIEITLSWFDKPATRLAEALWLSFNPRVEQPENWQLDKMGRLISPLDVISRGNRTLHAIQQGVVYHSADQNLHIDSLDAPLVAPGKRALVSFPNQQPDLAQGMHFNLYNNMWGTNFPMWFGE